MSEERRYDGHLQMFVEEAREPDFTRLAFLRWLGENGRLEHEVFGSPSGAYAERPVGERSVTELRELPLAS